MASRAPWKRFPGRCKCRERAGLCARGVGARAPSDRGICETQGMSSLAVASLAALLGAPALVSEPPRLVVVLSVDQLRPDQLTRLTPALTGGLGRMLREGTEFRSATLDYAATETGPGHATLGTGCLPRTHGVVGNDMWLTGEQRAAYCFEELGAKRVTTTGIHDTAHPRGPRFLRVPTLAEHVRATYPKAKVVSIAGKDRSAIGMTGRVGDAVVWWDKGDGGFESSTAYGAALPEWVRAWNATWLAHCSGWRWTPLVSDGLTELGTDIDDREGEAVFGPFGRGFPYQLYTVEDPTNRDQLGRLAALVYASPKVDECVARLASEAVVHAGLGADDVPDVLTLSFSATDTVGHANGPFSWEVTDVVLRLDRELGGLFALLDERVGPGRWIAALSADHGVLPLPEQLRTRLVGVRRVGAGELRETREAVRAALVARYGEHLEKKFDQEGFVIDRARAAALSVDLVEARRIAHDAALGAIRAGSWLGGAYTYDELAAARASAARSAPADPAASATAATSGTVPTPPPAVDPWRALFEGSFDPERAYDVVFRNAPWTLVGNATGTSHGSCYPYDREIPLLFLGAGVPRGVRSDAAGSHDVAPTLLALLEVAALGPMEGRALFPAR